MVSIGQDKGNKNNVNYQADGKKIINIIVILLPISFSNSSFSTESSCRTSASDSAVAGCGSLGR